MIDLLDRLTTDARIADARRSSARIAQTGLTNLSPYGAALRDQIASEASMPPSDAAGKASLPSSSLPRTLLLVTSETMCSACGCRYRAPNPTVFGVYDDRSRSIFRDADAITKLLRWCEHYNHKPLREHQTITVYAPACEACF